MRPRRTDGLVSYCLPLEAAGAHCAGEWESSCKSLGPSEVAHEAACEWKSSSRPLASGWDGVLVGGHPVDAHPVDALPVDGRIWLGFGSRSVDVEILTTFFVCSCCLAP